MRNGRFLPAFFTLLFLFAVVSCRDNEQAQPKPNKTKGARLVSNGISIEDWEANLSWQQNNFLNQQADRESIEYALWNDERNLAGYLSGKGFSQNIDIAYPLFCFQAGAISALHVASVGASLAQTWVQMTYADASSPYGNDVMFNFNVGKQVAQLYPSASDLPAKVYNEMFLTNANYKVPGAVSVGTHFGVPLYKNPLGTGWGSFTLPSTTRAKGRIYLDPTDYNNTTLRPKLIRHEFGHILQGEQLGLQCFYSEIVPYSIASASPISTHDHDCAYTETHANRLSIAFHNTNEPAFVWDYTEFPISCPGYANNTPCH
ncbi:MAG: hypothetical protein EOO61_02890 [Hymenobacter sp.]|nr:MAG: hypothetical protein EOO61_02890 [Hymenobacter sp.]